MIQRLSKFALAAAVAASLAAGPLAAPASASTGSTWTIVESAAALIGGIVLYNNYEHKKQAANRIVGYTRNGGTVYGDGRIVMPNGQTVYPNANGQYPWGQYAYYRPNANGYTYDYGRTGRYDRTRRHDDEDDNYRGGQRPYYNAGNYARPNYTRPNDGRANYGRQYPGRWQQRGRDRDGGRGREHGHGHGHGHGGDGHGD